MFDTTIHLSDVVMVGGGIIAFVKVFMSQQKQTDKVIELLGRRDIKERRSGVLGDIQCLEESFDGHIAEDRIIAADVREVRLSLGFDRRGGMDRRTQE